MWYVYFTARCLQGSQAPWRFDIAKLCKVLWRSYSLALAVDQMKFVMVCCPHAQTTSTSIGVAEEQGPCNLA
jgi:hypothetical protein